MFGLFTKHCQTCNKVFQGPRYKWRIEGKKLVVCQKCNGQLQRRAGTMKFGRSGPPARESFLKNCSSTISTLLIAALGIAAAVGIGHWRTTPKQQEVVETADATLRKAVKAAVADETAMADNEMLLLESKDGRTIRAQILTLSQRDVFIRRDDKKEFRVPLSQLTDASLRKIEAFNPSLSGNVQ